MGWRVILTRPALADLENIVTFLAAWSPQVALSMGAELVEAIFSLDFMPRRGSLVQNRTDLRKLVRRHYLIFYRVDEAREAVEIARIWDARRDAVKLELPERNPISPAQGDGP